jgi:hypothetical protein
MEYNAQRLADEPDSDFEGHYGDYCEDLPGDNDPELAVLAAAYRPEESSAGATNCATCSPSSSSTSVSIPTVPALLSSNNSAAFTTSLSASPSPEPSAEHVPAVPSAFPDAAEPPAKRPRILGPVLPPGFVHGGAVDDHAPRTVGFASVLSQPGNFIHGGCVDWPAKDCSHSPRCYKSSGQIDKRRRKTARHYQSSGSLADDPANAKRGKGGVQRAANLQKHQKKIERKLGKQKRKITVLAKKNRQNQKVIQNGRH